MENNIITTENNLMTTQENAQYCSYVANTEEEKKKLFKALNNPDKRLADCVNMELEIKDVIAEIVETHNEETGEIQKAPRVVLIDKEGTSYQCVSSGIFNAVKKLMLVFGQPTWKKPIKVKVIQITKGTRKILSLDI